MILKELESPLKGRIPDKGTIVAGMIGGVDVGKYRLGVVWIDMYAWNVTVSLHLFRVLPATPVIVYLSMKEVMITKWLI